MGIFNLLALACASVGSLRVAEATMLGSIQATTSLNDATKIATATLVLDREAWIGFGIAGDGDNMGNKGTVYICEDDGTSNDNWVYRRVDPTQLSTSGISGSSNDISAPVTSASCTYDSGTTTTTLTLTYDISDQDSENYKISDDGDATVIWACGASGTKTVQYHSGNRGRSTINFQSNTGSALDKSLPTIIAAHAALLVLAWVVLVPLGIICARYFKSADPTWFHLHRVFMALAVVFTIAGVTLGLYYTRDYDVMHTSHYRFGLAILALAVLLPILGVVRPKKEARYRSAWHVLHGITGLVAFSISVAQVFLGLDIFKSIGFDDDAKIIFASVAAAYGLEAVTIIVFELGKWNILPISFVQDPKESYQ